MSDGTIQAACVSGMIICACVVFGTIFPQSVNQMTNGLVADGIVTPAQSSGPTRTVEQYRAERTQRGRAQVTRGDELPSGVTPETMRRDREDPRTGCAECMDPKWALMPDWHDSPMFKKGGFYEVRERPDGSVDHIGIGWDKKRAFSKTPPGGRGYGN